ncbi:MAG: acyl-ACP--UDP-N-acetylglucosamine O-acyltransferase [Thermoguttaceae bacterium]|jgi:UDP-N-acetylglucosamine acyltransferase
MNIHPSALVSPSAIIGPSVRVGPFCVIEDDVSIGDGCILENHVILKQCTTLGAHNRVFDGAVLGGLPQHVEMPPNPGRLIIGDNNTIRENVTIHRALRTDRLTSVGDHCLIMANAHVAHDCTIGSQVILTNNVMLAGHVSVGDRAYLSGGAAVHQFCRIGSLAMVGGQAHIVKDVPPFVTIDGQSSYVVGLNQIGLKRAGHPLEVILELKNAYRLIYRSGLIWAEMLDRLRREFTHGLAAQFHPFLSTTTRGIIPERRLPPGATIKLQPAAENQLRLRYKVG